MCKLSISLEWNGWLDTFGNFQTDSKVDNLKLHVLIRWANGPLLWKHWELIKSGIMIIKKSNFFLLVDCENATDASLFNLYRKIFRYLFCAMWAHCLCCLFSRVRGKRKTLPYLQGCVFLYIKIVFLDVNLFTMQLLPITLYSIHITFLAVFVGKQNHSDCRSILMF